MNIFDKRPLCLILSVALGGFVIFSLCSDIFKGIIAIASILLAFIPLFLGFKHKSHKTMFVASIALCVSILFSHLYFDCYFRAYEKYVGNHTVTALVEDISPASSYSSKITVRTESIDGKRARYTFYGYIQKDDKHTVSVGSVVSFRATISDFSNSESRSYSHARGCSAVCEDISELTVIEERDTPISATLSRMREYASRYTTMLCDSDSGALLSALLFGERDMLSDKVRLDFKRIGISHVLALSGMHLAILAFGIKKMLSLFGLGKKSTTFIVIAFTIAYMAFTGFSVSITRAGIMLILASLLWLFRKCRDSLTSLSVASAVIVIAEPYSIYDVSLPLTVLATFGIILAAEYWRSRERKQKKTFVSLLEKLALALLVSVFAVSATLLITSYVFNGVSALSVFSTLVFSILVETIMYLGCIMLAVGWIIPVGKLLIPLCSFTTEFAARLSDIDFVYLSVDSIAFWIAVTTLAAAIYLFAVLKIKKKNLAIIIISFLYVATSVIPIVSSSRSNSQEDILYSSSNRADELLIKSNGEFCLINSSGYSKNLAYDTLDFVAEARLTRIDKYYLTHYSWSIDDELSVLLASIRVEKIYIPAPQNEDEEAILAVIEKVLLPHACELIIFDENESVSVGEYEISLLYSAPYGETSVNAFSVSSDEQRLTYISSGLLDGKHADSMLEKIAESDTVILGTHGKKYKKAIYIDEFYRGLENLIISGENVFLTQSTMKSLEENDCRIISHPSDTVSLLQK